MNNKFTNITIFVTPIFWDNMNHCNSNYSFLYRVDSLATEYQKYIISDNKYIYNFFKNHYPNISSNYNLLYLGLEDRSDKIDTFSNKKDPMIEILFIGRMEHRKGVDLLLSVIPDLCEKYSNILFRFVGKDTGCAPGEQISYKQHFLNKIHNKSYSNRIIFEGVVEDTTIYYNNCDIFIAPSRFESFGLIYVEAMIFSKPIIACNVAAVPEVVKDGITGLLASVDDVNSLKQCLITLIENKNLREKMGKAGRERYEKLFTAERMVNDMLDYMNKLFLNK